jgi:hypothetical protein
MWCPDGQRCGPDLGLKQQVCVVENVCGNGITEGDEDCDCGSGPILPSDPRCATSGWCGEGCKLRCGNGILDDKEICEPGLPVPRNCTDLGYDFGRPDCSASCTITEDKCEDWTWRPVDVGAHDAHYAHDTFNAIWGSQPNDIWVSGIDVTLRYDGHEFLPQTDAPLLFDMWGSGPDDIFGLEADTSDGDHHGQVIWHYDGTGWEVVHRDTDKLVAIWGITASDNPREVFVLKEPSAMDVGAASTDGVVKLLHCNVSDCTDTDAAMAWTDMTTTTTARQHAIWGRGPSDVFTVGDSGVTLHYDGGGWNVITAGHQDLNGIWGANDDVYVVGDQGTLLHSTGNGSSWSSVDTNVDISSSNLLAIWGSGSDDIFVIGTNDLVLHFDGGSWQSMMHHTDSFPSRIWGTGPGDVYATSFGATMRHYDGTDLQLMTYPGGHSASRLQDVLVHGENSAHALAVGSTNTIIQYDGSSWQQLSASIFKVAGCANPRSIIIGIFDCSDQICAINNIGGVVAYRAQDTSTECLVRPSITWPPQPGWQMTSVWSTGVSTDGPVDIYAAGSNGIVMYSPGGSQAWQQMRTGVNGSLRAIWEGSPRDVWAVGENGAVVHYDGNRWQPMTPPSGQTWRAVWGSGPQDVYVAGESNASGRGGSIMHFRGDQQQPETFETDQGAINAVWGSSQSDVYAVGDGGLLLYNDGTGWLPMRSDETLSLSGIGGDPTGRTRFIVGDQGTIYRMTHLR